jgi:hypothetical protein
LRLRDRFRPIESGTEKTAWVKRFGHFARFKLKQAQPIFHFSQSRTQTSGLISTISLNGEDFSGKFLSPLTVTIELAETLFSWLMAVACLRVAVD